MTQTENAASIPETLILINCYYCLFDSSDEEYHIHWINCANMSLLLLLIGIKSGRNKTVRSFVALSYRQFFVCGGPSSSRMRA